MSEALLHVHGSHADRSTMAILYPTKGEVSLMEMLVVASIFGISCRNVVNHSCAYAPSICDAQNRHVPRQARIYSSAGRQKSASSVGVLQQFSEVLLLVQQAKNAEGYIRRANQSGSSIPRTGALSRGAPHRSAASPKARVVLPSLYRWLGQRAIPLNDVEGATQSLKRRQTATQLAQTRVLCDTSTDKDSCTRRAAARRRSARTPCTNQNSRHRVYTFGCGER